MCSYKFKKQGGVVDISTQATLSHINGRPVLQPYSNRVPLFDQCHKKSPNFKISPSSLLEDRNVPLKDDSTETKMGCQERRGGRTAKVKNSPPISPKIKSPKQQQPIKKVNDSNNILNTSVEKIVTPKKSPNFKISPSSLFLSNGDEDRNVPLKDSTETKMSYQERRGGRTAKVKSSPPISPKIKKVNDSSIINTSSEKIVTPKNSPNHKISSSTPPVSPKDKSPRQQPAIKKVKKNDDACSKKGYSSFMVVEVAGSIAAARREQVANMQVQRKQRIAHYGRTNSAKFNEAKLVTVDSSSREAKRCSFITPNSDPVYIAYHDEEWGVPVHDDNLLFELLVLTVAQVGSDWTSVLKKRQDFRDAFSGFDPEIVAKYNEKKINSTSSEYGIELSQVRGVVDNSKRILEIKREFGSYHKYLWGFVSNKPIATQYKACNKMPVKTSKSETMSKDMVKRGFRYVGPTVIHSFMQAVGLTNDHIVTCPRHAQCAILPTQQPIAM